MAHFVITLRPTPWELREGDDGQQFVEALRDLLRRELKDDHPLGHRDSTMWARLVGMGILHAIAGGGEDTSTGLACALAEELGRALAPVSLFPAIAPAAMWLTHASGDGEFDVWRERVLSGDKLSAPTSSHAFKGSLTGRRTHLGIELRGVIAGVEELSEHTPLAVVAQVGGDLHVCLASPAADGVATHVRDDIDSIRRGVVSFSDTPVLCVGQLTVRQAQLVECRARLVHAAWMLGAGYAALDRAVDYARDRVQFGHPIGSFQAIQHQLSEVAVALVGAHRLTQAVAGLLDDEALPTATATAAHLAAKRALRCSSRTAQQVFGGLGYASESRIHHYYMVSLTHQSVFGDVAQDEAALGDAALRAGEYGSGLLAREEALHL